MIQQAREKAISELKAAVQRAGITLEVHSIVPSSPTPPALILGEADSFVTSDGCSFGEVAVSFDGVIIVETRPADRAKELSELDEIVSALMVETLTTLSPQIRGYAPITMGNSQPLLSARITFTLLVSIGD